MIYKIKSLRAMIKICQKLRQQGKKVVVMNGSYDILHAGHITSFEAAKSHGDVLIVLVNSDNSIKLYKGQNHPFNSEKDRVKLLSALSVVDYVVVFDELTPNVALSVIKPSIYCLASEWGKGSISDATVKVHGGKIVILKHVDGLSTSGLVKKIIKQAQRPMVRAVFLDRDGTINRNNPEHVHKIEDFKFLPGVISGLKRIAHTDYKMIILTNQAGIGRGYYTVKEFKKLDTWMKNYLKKQGIKIAKTYYCPHHPEKGLGKYKKNCDCRKPGIGNILKAAREFGINLSKSWLIGDDVKDILAGRAANVKTIFVGKGNKAEFSKYSILPNYFAKNFFRAAQIITPQH